MKLTEKKFLQSHLLRKFNKRSGFIDGFIEIIAQIYRMLKYTSRFDTFSMIEKKFQKRKKLETSERERKREEWARNSKGMGRGG